MGMSLDLGGGGSAFPFNTVGDSVTGTILDMEEVQQTDMETGAPAVWDNGQPKVMYRIDLATVLKDDAFDDGKRSVYLRGSRKSEKQTSLSAVLDAVRVAGGGSKLEKGATLTLTFSGEGVPSKRGWNAPKLYTATYVPPAKTVDLNPAPAATAPQQAPKAPAGLPAGFDPANLSPEALAAIMALQGK